MKLVTVEQMRNLDTATSREYGISSLILMENAGRAVAEEILRFLGGSVKDRRILVFTGKGNNGGDGFVAARNLSNWGADVRVFLLYPREEITGDALVNLEILEKLGVSIKVLGPRDIQKVKVSLIYADLVLDAIFGTGFKGTAKGIAASVIRAINESGKRSVVSVDLPSGLQADSGRVEGPCIHASLTCTLGLPKLGFYLYPGVDYCGEIRVMDISLPGRLLRQEALQFNLIDEDFCCQLFPPREKDSHKGSFGHVFVAGGSVGMTGAVVLAGEASLKGGAGLVSVCIPASLNHVIENKLTAVMSIPMAENEDHVLGTEAAGALLKKISKNDVIAVGPGLSILPGTEGFVQELILKTRCPIVIDADGLNVVADNTDIFWDLNVPGIITPHPGEMGRLLGCSPQEVQEDRVNAAKTFAGRYGLVVVLKGANTIVADPEGRVFINTTGNPGMATAGAGDVLAGLIASFVAQGMSPVDAAVAGTYVHGAAADRLLDSVGERGMTAEEILENLPCTIAKLEKLNMER